MIPWACARQHNPETDMLKSQVEAILANSEGEVALYYEDLGDAETLLLHPDVRMHAASTMKVPVMIQLFADREAGLLDLDGTLTVKTTFSSIVDGSPYSLSPDSDSEHTLYLSEGHEVTYRHLIDLMITVSSNLATNILIETAEADRITSSMRALGADSIMVLRGVEDGPAFRAGLSNTTTARDLGIIMAALGRGQVVSPAASEEMLEIMSRQQWRTKIPAGLPEGVRVAHKTGRITGISHDAGVVLPFKAPPYALVILTRGFQDPDQADGVAAEISRVIFDYHTRKY
jgi:beta-lactamase class A